MTKTSKSVKLSEITGILLNECKGLMLLSNPKKNWNDDEVINNALQQYKENHKK